MEKSDSTDFSARYLENLLQGNRTNCSAIAREYLAMNPSFLDLYEEVFKVSLYKIGLLWETNKISVATEHMATAITEGILNEYFEQIISKTKLNRKVVVACVENEQHQVGVKMVADTFEMLGWESSFLGTGIPIAELIRYINELKPDLLAISLTVYFNFNNLIKMLNRIRTEFPELTIIVGGQAFSRVPADTLYKTGNVILLSDLYLLKKYIELLNQKTY
jgi:methanogenic corrinoid protein MtbC1